MSELTHLDAAGRARMVDVTGKPDTAREAIAKGEVLMQPETLALIRQGQVAKGDVLAVAQVAGGGGGGRPEMAQAGGKNRDKLDQALQLPKKLLQKPA